MAQLQRIGPTALSGYRKFAVIKKSVLVKLWGGAGGQQAGACSGPNGPGAGYVNVSSGLFPAGTTFYIYVGGGGISNSSLNPSSGTFGGGGASYAGGADGGGASYVFLNGAQGTGTLLVVAGGSGGGAGGGVGGGSTGGSGGSSGGGSQTTGGSAGTDGFGGGGGAATAGTYLQGGIGMSCKGSGGGGGYYGGGGGQGDCGSCAAATSGGGSSYINSSYFSTVYNDQGNTNGTVSTNAAADGDWNSSAGTCNNGGNGNPGYIVIYVNGVKYTYSYTGSYQTLTI